MVNSLQIMDPENQHQNSDDQKAKLKKKLSTLRNERKGLKRQELQNNKEAVETHNVKKTDQKKMKKNVKSQKIDDILKDLNINDPNVKNELITAMQNGRIKNVNDLSSWLALHAPLSQVRPQDVLTVQEASKEADEMAKRMANRMKSVESVESVESVQSNETETSTKHTRHIRNPRDIEKQVLDQQPL